MTLLSDPAPTDERGDIPAAESFIVAPDGLDQPAELAAHQVATLHEFLHIRAGEPVILFLMREESKVKGGRTFLGEMCLPRFQGALAPVGAWLLAKSCGGLPDFILIIDHVWWRICTLHQRKALIHHELMHIGHAKDREGEFRFTDDGKPVWELRPHDIEEFNQTVERFGAWSSDIILFQDALQRSGNARGID